MALPSTAFIAGAMGPGVPFGGGAAAPPGSNSHHTPAKGTPPTSAASTPPSASTSPLLLPVPVRTLTVPSSSRRIASAPSPPLPWTFPNGNGNGHANGAPHANANGHAGRSAPALKRSETPPYGLTYSNTHTQSPRQSPRHSRSLSTSPSPPPIQRTGSYPSSPPAHSAHRRLSSASVPQLSRHAPQLSPNSFLPPPEMPQLSRQSSTKSAAMASVGSYDPPALADLKEVHPLQGQIDKLIEKCSQHELKFRSARSSFEHRVLTELPSLLSELTKLDDRAEVATASIYAAIKTARPQLQEKLDHLIETAEGDVETIKERTTPWADLLEPSSSDTTPDADAQSVVSTSTRSGFYSGGTSLRRIRSGDQRRISKIERMKNVNDDSYAEALRLIEGWGEEIIYSLSDQILSLKAQLVNEAYRRILFMRLIGIVASVVVALLALWGFRRSSAPEPLTLPSS